MNGLFLGSKNVDAYDPIHRNPLYCGADRTVLWELQKVSSVPLDLYVLLVTAITSDDMFSLFQLLHHFHPSVVQFAKTVLEVTSFLFKVTIKTLVVYLKVIWVYHRASPFSIPAIRYEISHSSDSWIASCLGIRSNPRGNVRKTRTA